MGSYTYRFGNETTVSDGSGGSTTYRAGESFFTADACEMLAFMARVRQADPDRHITEETADALENLRAEAQQQGCLNDDGTTPAQTSSGAESGPPPDGDTPEAQGAPRTDQPAADVRSERDAGYDPNSGETPTNALHDPERPASAAEVTEGLVNNGASPGDAADAAERARRGENGEGEERSTHTGQRARADQQDGDPVQLFTGRLVLRSVDIDIPSPFLQLRFVRQYLSGRPYYGPLGFNWDHNWNVYLRELNSGDVARWSGELHEDVFRWNGVEFEPPPGIFERLERDPGIDGRYVIRTNGGGLLRFERPAGFTDQERIPLTLVTDKNGNRIELAYDTANRLARVQDGDGRFFRLHYGACDFLERVEDHAGRSVQYFHDQMAEHLVAVRLPTTQDQPEGVFTKYTYSYAANHLALQHNITLVTDHDENTVLVNEYGEDPTQHSFNRVVRQYVGGTAFTFEYEQIQYVPQNALFVRAAAKRTSVHHPDGSLWTYTFNYRGDLLDERYRLNADGSYRVVATQREFDEQGNLTRMTRPDGSMTEWSYDSTNPDPRSRANLLRVELRSGGLAPVPSRVIIRSTYDAAHQVVRSVRYENGVEQRMLYDFDLTPGAPNNRGLLMRVEWPDVTLPDGTVQAAVTQLEWNTRGQVTAVVSPAGVRRELIYEPDGSVFAGFTAEIHEDVTGAALVVAMTYDLFGYLSTRTVPGGHVYRYQYDAMGRLVEHTLPEVDGQIDRIRYRYNGSSRIVQVERPRGEYDDGMVTGEFLIDQYKLTPDGRLEQITIASNCAQPRIWKVQSDWSGRPYRIEDPMGTITERCWDERGLLLQETRAAGTPEALRYRFFYDTSGREFRREEPGSVVTTQSYDPWGRPLEVVYPNGSRGRNRWGDFDLLVEQELFGDPGNGAPDRILRQAKYAYDERGRLVRHTEAVFTEDPATGVSLSMEKWYDADGRVVRRVSPQGEVFHILHDGVGRLLRTQDPLGNARQYTYGSNGLIASITETDATPDGLRHRTSTFDSDARGRLVRTTHPSGATYEHRYDARDLIVSSTDAMGIETQRTYGLLGERLLLRFDPAGLSLDYAHTFDAVGREMTFTDPTGELTTVTRDAHGRLTEIQFADGSISSRNYTSAGKLNTETSADGSSIVYKYDSAQRLIGFDITSGPGRLPVSPHTIAYDGANRVVQASGSTTTVKGFDSLDRLVSESRDGRVFERTFDDLAMTVILKYPDGRQERQDLDPLGRVQEVTLEAPGSSALAAVSGAAGQSLLEVSYAGAQRVAALRYGNGVTTEWHHDDDGRLIRVDHSAADGTLLESARYQHELYNRRRVKQLIGQPPENNLYEYDNRGRLTEQRVGFSLAPLADEDTQPGQDAAIATAEAAAATAERLVQWAVDGSDTRTAMTQSDSGGSATIPYVTGPGHQTVAVDTNPLTYDADGHRTSDHNRSYTYDGLGRIARIDEATGSNVATFEYDAFGRWAGGTLSGAPLHRFHFGSDCLQEESASSVERQNMVLPGCLVPLLSTTTSGHLCVHLDGAHSALLVTDSAGAPVERYRYSAFGEPTIFDGSGTTSRDTSAVGLAPLFNGMLYHPSAHVYVTVSRPYDPTTGLFLARDPLLHAQSPSPYVFALHDPVNGLDPDGNLPPLIIAGLIVGGIGAVIGGGAVMLGSDDWDFWDVLAGTAIGFGAGFIGATTFGWAAGAIGGSLLTAAGGTAVVGQSAWMGTAISVTSGVGAGAFSGLASGLFSGGANGVYHGGIRGRGDMWQMIGEGMYREGISGMGAGAVTGGLFQGALLAGRPGVTWSALRSSFGGGQPARVIGRGLLSPYGLGGAGAGFAGGMTGGVTRNMLEGDDFSTAVSDSWGEGLFSAGAGAFMTAAHPTTYSYWRARLSPSHAAAIESTRPGQVHHQRNVAQYPEYAVREGPPRAPHTFIDRLNNAVTRGNVQGPQSTYLAPNNPLTHVQMHEQWRFGQTFNPNGWTNVPTHGPWTPPWMANLAWPNALGQGHSDKEQ